MFSISHENAFVFAATQFCFMLLWIIFVFLFFLPRPDHLNARPVLLIQNRYTYQKLLCTTFCCNVALSLVPCLFPFWHVQHPEQVPRRLRRLVPVRWSRGLEASRRSGVSDGKRRRNCWPELTIATMKVSMVGDGDGWTRLPLIKRGFDKNLPELNNIRHRLLHHRRIRRTFTLK